MFFLSLRKSVTYLIIASVIFVVPDVLEAPEVLAAPPCDAEEKRTGNVVLQMCRHNRRAKC